MDDSTQVKAQSAHTPGPWRVQKTFGWGNALCIHAGDATTPMFISTKPDGYYTKWAQTEDGADILSTKEAEKAGNYVATKEIQARFDAIEAANARLIAAAPFLLEALNVAEAALMSGDTQTQMNAWTHVCGAIAKATGDGK